MKVKCYLEEISHINAESLVYIDETGFDKYLFREHCYSPKGQTVIGRVKGRKFARKSVVAGQCRKELVAPLMYDGTMDSALFEQWFTECLIPETTENQVFIMDNASFHRKKKLQDICGRYNRKIIFLPPYSPELNPIEKTWALIKKLLRKILPQHETMEDAICFAFNSI